MLRDHRPLNTEKLRDLRLCHPQGFALIPNVESQALIGAVYQKSVAGFLIFDQMDRLVVCHVAHHLMWNIIATWRASPPASQWRDGGVEGPDRAPVARSAKALRGLCCHIPPAFLAVR